MESSSINWDYPEPFLLDVSVDASHIDGLKHVNNAVYVSWCEDAGWAHSIELGLGIDDYHNLNRAMAIRHSEFDYLQAGYLNDQLLVATWLTASDGKLAMERRFQLLRKSDGATLLRARWDLVCIEITSGRPKRMPEDFKRIYGAAVIDL
ncbi:acyl-CoA thioesterase [Agarilytica rhodophyticola]|uniref:acyl-CoA thioesterase n=1 Tax=Agarilytica rhodophyticola TaxID=1737490 RepID=UPI00156EA588|nr:thioesterase family protein [Agarilytica rhodophyticola]